MARELGEAAVNYPCVQAQSKNLNQTLRVASSSKYWRKQTQVYASRDNINWLFWGRNLREARKKMPLALKKCLSTEEFRSLFSFINGVNLWYYKPEAEHNSVFLRIFRIQETFPSNPPKKIRNHLYAIQPAIFYGPFLITP